MSLKDKVKKTIATAENYFTTEQKVAIGTLVTATIAALLFFAWPTDKTVTSAVMITKASGRSGGSGVVIANSPNESTVLTNKHVCQLAKTGGVVKTFNDKVFQVSKILEYKDHDLCLVEVKADLGSSVTVAQSPPKSHGKAIISGHPALLPNVVSSGHFSSRQSIEVFTGTRACTEEDMKDEAVGMLCLFFGNLPVIERYDSQLVTALIMAGSSGSGVFNGNGELNGLVFAGAGDLSFAFIVPHEYVTAFLKDSANTPKSEWLNPNNIVNIKSLLNQKKGTNSRSEAIAKCANIDNAKPQIEAVCSILVSDLNKNYPIE